MDNDLTWGAGLSTSYTLNLGATLGDKETTQQRTPLFRAFYEQWRQEKLPEWRSLHLAGVDQIAAAHLLPWFGEHRLSELTREEVLKFRAYLAGRPGTQGRALSAFRINKIMVIFKQIMGEAAQRYVLSDPTKGIRKLKAPRPSIDPFTLDEVWQICEAVGEAHRDYLLCRFFTGMRTGEINGLRWSRVDFPRNVIQVRETFSAGRSEANAKSQQSIRDIPMLPVVRQTLLERQKRLCRSRQEYIFSSPRGNPIDAKNFTNRAFYPALDRLGIERRRPYQTRHTTATLLLAAGENPEWIARFLGHADTTMLFTVYSNYVPNLTRRDGSAISALLAAQPDGKASGRGER